MAKQKKISPDDCYEIILKNIYDAISDDNCFYRYQVSDKRKDDEGMQISIINEFVLEKMDTKMLKEIISALGELSQIKGEKPESTGGVIVLKEIE